MNLRLNKIIFLVLLALLAVLTQGCSLFNRVGDNQAGIHTKGGRIVGITDQGIVSKWGYWDEVDVIDLGVKTFSYDEPTLATKDKQMVGATIGVSVRRNPDSILTMYKDYRLAAMDDSEFQRLVFDRLARVAKANFSKRNIDDLLGIGEQGGRDNAAAEIKEALQKEVEEFGGWIVDIGINDIRPSDAYRALMEEKAAANGRTDVARSKKLEKEEELKSEQAQTAIELERASRNRQVQEEEAKVLLENPILVDLRKYELWTKALQNANTIYIPSDTTLFLNGQDNPDKTIVPVQPKE